MTDIKKTLITSALPYINGIKHLGNLAGSLLPADIHARYRRQTGDDVLSSAQPMSMARRRSLRPPKRAFPSPTTALNSTESRPTFTVDSAFHSIISGAHRRRKTEH